MPGVIQPETYRRSPPQPSRAARGPSLPARPSREELAVQLTEARIAGSVATPRENNLANFRLLATRDPGYLFGLEPRGVWTFEDVLALMAQRCGVSPDPLHDAGDDTIDPALTLDRLDDMAAVLREAAAERARVLVATGHPTGLLVVHLEAARALRAAGCTLLAPAARWEDLDSGGRPHQRHVRSVLGVSVATQGANLLHTHSPVPMELMLGRFARKVSRRPTSSWPITASPARPAGPAFARSDSPIRTTQPCSSARPRVISRSAFHSTTTSCRCCTSR